LPSIGPAPGERFMHRYFLPAAIILTLCQARTFAAEPLFERDVRPILKAHCFQCHGEEPKPRGKLDLRLPSLMLKGGGSRTAIVAGNRDESLLLQKTAAGEMRRGKKRLTRSQLEVIRRWVAAGAKTARPEPKNPDDLRITEEERGYWAFQPVKAPPVPQ